jgi:putative membrane protein
MGGRSTFKGETIMKTKLTITCALALSLAACGGNNSADNATGDAGSAASNLTTEPSGNETATSTDVMMNGAVATTPTTAAEFANMAAGSDQFEIKSSQLAATQASSAGVKSFAAMLIQEHTKSTNDLKAAAAKASPAVTPAPALTAEQQANLDALGKVKGAAFDTLYAQVQVPAHENALAMMQGYAARGDQAPLKDFASKTAPVIQKHLDQARGLAK